MQIVFEAIRGKGFSSDVAVDDIQITSGSCPPKQRETRGFVKYPFRLLSTLNSKHLPDEGYVGSLRSCRKFFKVLILN